MSERQRILVLTGASRGIGHATAKRFSDDGWRVITEKKTAWVVKEANNKIVAFGPQCTHLGCAYHWDGGIKQFACPCHASFFSIEGQVLAGPAPRPLDRYVTRIENNRLQIGQLKRSANA